jgi:lipopolysaccharide transport system ATP-binding protein
LGKSLSQSAIVVEKLSKRYLIGHRHSPRGQYKYVALRDVFGREIKNFARKAIDVARGRQVVQGDEVEEFWALKGVSFEVKQGEVLGIVGRNGAGKSTLLKILSRITEPTEGRILLRGRVSSMLEVGTGFHPELTGRENIFLNGAILGMTQREIRKKFDEIVGFAEVEKFLDTPVKHYSSGMYVRLAFAVAAHLEPEILIVDEVLAVGDAEFQRKCLGKMNEVSRIHGRTVLVVTHNMGVITSLCPSAIWIDKGTVRQHSSARAIVSAYQAQRMPNQKKLIALSHLQRPQALAEDRLRLESIEWLCNLPLQHGEPFRARITFNVRSPISDVSIGIGFSSYEGKRLLTYDTDFPDGHRPDIVKPGTYSVEVEVESLPLAPDIYSFDIGGRSSDFHSLDYILGCFEIGIIAGPKTPGFIDRKDGCVRLASKWFWQITPR